MFYKILKMKDMKMIKVLTIPKESLKWSDWNKRSKLVFCRTKHSLYEGLQPFAEALDIAKLLLYFPIPNWDLNSGLFNY